MTVTFKNHNEWLRDHPVNSSRGAPMGCGDDAMLSDIKVHIDKLHWVDGDYLRDGTYYGRSGRDFIYAIWQDTPGGERLCSYFRGRTRDQAVRYAVEVLHLIPLRGSAKARNE